MERIFLAFICLAVVDAQISPWSNVPIGVKPWPGSSRVQLTTNLGSRHQLQQPQQQLLQTGNQQSEQSVQSEKSHKSKQSQLSLQYERSQKSLQSQQPLQPEKSQKSKQPQQSVQSEKSQKSKQSQQSLQSEQSLKTEKSQKKQKLADQQQHEIHVVSEQTEKRSEPSSIDITKKKLVMPKYSDDSQESEKKETTWQDWFALALDIGSDYMEGSGWGKIAYHP